MTQIETFEYNYDSTANPLSKLTKADLHLPQSLKSAIEKRQNDFILGRFCAKQAITKLIGTPFTDYIPISQDKGPKWPSNIVGSITHTKGFAAASVAFKTDYLSLGLDAEHVIKEASSSLIKHICVRGEFEQLSINSLLDKRELLTLIFSSKESLYKLLNPLTKVFFGFDHAKVEHIDLINQVLQIRLVKDLPQFPKERQFLIHFRKVGSAFITSGSLLSGK